jgi:hypothetical protein
MNNQFATQFLRKEVDPNWLENYMKKLGADEELIQYTLALIQKGLIQPERALEIMKQTLGLKEDGGAAAAAPAGGSTTGGGVTNGATFTPGTGEQYAAGTRRKRSMEEDAPMLAAEPSKTNKQGAKNLDAYGSVGFTKAPNAEEAGKQMKGIDVDMLWKEALEESRAYSQFKREAAMRSKPDQLHQAVKMIQHKLQEVEKLLEFTSQMRNDLSEGEATVEYKHNTKKVFERIHSKVVEVYTKVKGLK